MKIAKLLHSEVHLCIPSAIFIELYKLTAFHVSSGNLDYITFTNRACLHKMERIIINALGVCKSFQHTLFLKTGCTCSVFSVYLSGVRGWGKVSLARQWQKWRWLTDSMEIIMLEAVSIVNAWQRKENNPFIKLSQEFWSKIFWMVMLFKKWLSWKIWYHLLNNYKTFVK